MGHDVKWMWMAAVFAKFYWDTAALIHYILSIAIFEL